MTTEQKTDWESVLHGQRGAQKLLPMASAPGKERSHPQGGEAEWDRVTWRFNVFMPLSLHLRTDMFRIFFFFFCPVKLAFRVTAWGFFKLCNISYIMKYTLGICQIFLKTLKPIFKAQPLGPRSCHKRAETF